MKRLVAAMLLSILLYPEPNVLERAKFYFSHMSAGVARSNNLVLVRRNAGGHCALLHCAIDEISIIERREQRARVAMRRDLPGFLASYSVFSLLLMRGVR